MHSITSQKVTFKSLALWLITHRNKFNSASFSVKWICTDNHCEGWTDDEMQRITSTQKTTASFFSMNDSKCNLL